jgi:hypothetical protein
VFFQMILFVWMFMLDLAAICKLSDEAKDLELLLVYVFSDSGHLRGKNRGEDSSQ